MINHLLTTAMSLPDQMSMIAARGAMNSTPKNEGSFLELIDREEYIIAKPFFADCKINQPILHTILENRSAGQVFTDRRFTFEVQQDGVE
jgi:hypothetical protein